MPKKQQVPKQKGSVRRKSVGSGSTSPARQPNGRFRKGAMPPTGRQYARGKNSHDGNTFRRGPDRIARGTVRSLYQALYNDEGELAKELLRSGDARLPARAAHARSLLLALNDPRLAIQAGETIADRTEGRPRQVVEHTGRHETIFYRADQPPPPELLAGMDPEAAAGTVGGTATLSGGLEP